MPKKQEDQIPRFVITLTDTSEGGPTLSAGADELREFRKPLPPDERKPGVKNELDLMFKFFAEEVEKADASA